MIYKYILKRLALMIPVLLGVTFIVFFIMSLSPGNPVDLILGDNASQESKDALTKELGLDKPFIVRYADYVKNLLRGDMGKSYKTQLPVAKQIMDRFPNTLILAVASMAVAIALGIPLGIIAAKNHNKFIDNVTMVGSLVGISMPLFWLGLLLVIVFSVNLRILPSSGINTDSFLQLLRSLILPTITLATLPTAMIARMTRSSILEVIRQDYIDTARSKGVKEIQVTVSHMLKNALIPIITIAGLQFGSLLSGAILTETVFSWPGVGRLIVDAIKMKDIPTVLGGVVFLSIMFSVVNLIVDILYAFVDPRIKSRYTTRARRGLVRDQ